MKGSFRLPHEKKNDWDKQEQTWELPSQPFREGKMAAWAQVGAFAMRDGKWFHEVV